MSENGPTPPAKRVENLDARTPLIVHHVDGIGDRRLIFHLGLRQDEQASNTDMPSRRGLVRQQVVGILSFALFPDIPSLHHRIDRSVPAVSINRTASAFAAAPSYVRVCASSCFNSRPIASTF